MAGEGARPSVGGAAAGGGGGEAGCGGPRLGAWGARGLALRRGRASCSAGKLSDLESPVASLSAGGEVLGLGGGAGRGGMGWGWGEGPQ